MLKAVIQCVASLKRREKPTSAAHLSVGTVDEIQARIEAKKSLASLELSKDILEPLVHSTEQLVKWGYIVDIPAGEGSREPSLENKVSKCERCAQPFQVKRMEEADECTYHWGKALMTRVSGELISTKQTTRVSALLIDGVSLLCMGDRREDPCLHMLLAPCRF